MSGDTGQTSASASTVQPGDQDWRALRKECRLLGRTQRIAGLVLLALAPLFLLLFGLAAPAVFTQSFGLAEKVTATVTAVDVDDPHPMSHPGSGPSWTVAITWSSDGAAHRASAVTRAVDTPYTVGQQIEIAVAPFGTDVSLRSNRDAHVLLFVFVGCPVMTLVIAYFFWRRSRKWSPMLKEVTPSAPKRGSVLDDRPRQHTSALRKPHGRGEVIRIQHDGPPAELQTVLVNVGSFSSLPQSGEVVEVWRAIWAGHPQYALRSPTHGGWWLAEFR